MSSKLHKRRLRYINGKKKGESIIFIKNSDHVYCDNKFGNRTRIMTLYREKIDRKTNALP